ncbi:MAG: threonylcarbamoyl-AMP synthase [Candidatus Methanomethylicus sp.]|nr:threonylcarbamoyl-AMP synthase [Candidatus Methanomethylicus sp.]
MGSIIRLEEADPEKIRRVGEVVRNGGVIVFPTDTLYGIGGDPLNPSTVQRVLAIKRREKKPMPVLVSSIEMAQKFVDVDERAKKLMKAFWPGGLTIILRAKPLIPDKLTMGSNKLGIRMPDHAVALKIIEASGGGLIGTSANITGQPPATSVDELAREVEEAVDLIVDGGKTKLGVPSTVVELDSMEDSGRVKGSRLGSVRIIRVGAIGADLIESKLVLNKKGEKDAEF